VRQVLLTQPPGTAPPGLCSVAGGQECDVQDMVVLELTRLGREPGISPVCPKAVQP